VLLRGHATEDLPVGGVDVLAPTDLRPELEYVYGQEDSYSVSQYRIFRYQIFRFK
jgi:hypothetical protein